MVKLRVVVDTNVLLVAEGHSTYTVVCKANCGRLLTEIKLNHVVVLDAGREILREYGAKLEGRKGQPGLGYEFWKWLVNTRASYDRCESVTLNPNPQRTYEEFPDHPGLAHFDLSDRKFVSVAAAHPKRPRIVQAGDSKWWGWREPLSECGIKLILPCEDELRAKWEEKMGIDA